MDNERGLDIDRMRGVRRDVRISHETAGAELASMHAGVALSRAESALAWAERHWADAKRDALIAWRAHKADRADVDLRARYEERWEVCKIAYRSVKLARRVIAPLREFAAVAESAHFCARERAEGAAERGEYDEEAA